MSWMRRVAMLLTVAIAGSACQPSTDSPELQALVSAAAPPAGISQSAWADVRVFYDGRGRRLAWVNSKQATEQTIQAIDLLKTAETHGLNPSDYAEAELRKRALLLHGDEDSGERDGEQPLERRAITLAEFDVALTSSLLTLARHVATGRVSPAKVEPRWNVQREAPDVVAALQTAATNGIGSLLTAVQPKHPEYELLRGALAGMLVQRANGKASELEQRIRKVCLNLERWRWLPDDLGPRHFLVNVPAFHLYARENGNVTLDMRVVVGKRGNETPLFSDEMETVVFSPYWNVPETIALEETAPSVLADPEFLTRNNMEMLDAKGNVVSPEDIPWDDEGALAEYRFRQRPGPTNALGYVKFLFPNKHAVYLHDTPADALFKKIGRAFSHGCVRVEFPEKLASYVLRDQPEWTDAAIQQAMRAGTERHVKLSQKIPVHIVYFTAWVDQQGALQLADDVYGYDAKQARR